MHRPEHDDDPILPDFAAWQRWQDEFHRLYKAEVLAARKERDDLRELVNAAQMAETVASAERDALRRIFAALRKPSEAVKAVADATYWDRSVVKDVWGDVFSKAVEEAEREVAHD